jgi:hypothetical protein
MEGSLYQSLSCEEWWSIQSFLDHFCFIYLDLALFRSNDTKALRVINAVTCGLRIYYSDGNRERLL